MSALVVSLSVTTLVGSAAASPSAPETQGCSVLAQERNEGAHRLHEAWQGFNDQLRDLARDTRELGRGSHGRSATTMTVDARDEITDARAQLTAIWTAAHADLQDKVELGTVCKDPVVTESEDPHITLAALVENEDGTVTLSVQFNEKVTCTGDCKTLFTYTANDDATTTDVDAETFELSEDGTMAELTFELEDEVEVDGSHDELTFTSGSASLKDADSHTMANETESTVELSLQTNDLVKKYRDVVDQAIQDMQDVMDTVNADVAEVLEAGATEETSDDAVVLNSHAKAKSDRAKGGKPDGAGKPADAGKGKGRPTR